jgi:hypothetical protein
VNQRYGLEVHLQPVGLLMYLLACLPATPAVKVYPPAPDPTPGPNDYAPKDTLRKSAPAFTMHGSSQKVWGQQQPGRD